MCARISKTEETNAERLRSPMRVGAVHVPSPIGTAPADWLTFIRVLGTPGIESHGSMVSLPRKALALLALLAVEARVVSKDTLADRLWPESAQARANLRKAIMTVRDRLGDDALLVERRTIALGSTVGADSLELESGLARFEAHHPDADIACDDCLTDLNRASDCWRGDLLAGFTLADSPEFDEWRQANEVRLIDRRSHLLSVLVRAHVARGAWEAADRIASMALEHAPLDEAAHRARIRVLAWSGRRAEALRLYDHVTEVLAEQLGVAPSARSVALHDAIWNDTLPSPPSRPFVARSNTGSGDTQTKTADTDQRRQKVSPSHPSVARMLAAILAGQDPTSLPENLLREVAHHEPSTLKGYLLAASARRLAPPECLGRRYVPMDLVLATRARPGGDREPRRWSGLRQALEELDESTLIVLGGPGAGKTTLLRQLELDLSLSGAAGNEAPVPFFAPLSRFVAEEGTDRAQAPSPRAWIERLWRQKAGSLPPLIEVAERHGVLLLLDGLDEMPDRRAPDQGALIEIWRDFLRIDLPALTGLRIIFSCRELDYDIPLSGPETPAPRLRVAPLSRDAMRAFVEQHVVEASREKFWGRLIGSQAASLYRTPYLLRVLTEQAITGELPSDVAALLTAFVRSTLLREVERDHPALASSNVLHERDVRQLVHDVWSDRYDLPTRGRFVEGVETLAVALLQGQARGEASGGSIDRDGVRSLLGEDASAGVVSAALGLGLLTEDVATDQLRFEHRLLQDYFTARRLAEQPDLAPAGSPWRSNDMEEPPELAIERLDAHEPMPPLSTNGWEESLSMAAVMSQDPDETVLALAEADLPLAGRVIAAVPGRFLTETTGALRSKLMERSLDPSADIRARIAAAEALGELGDPRLALVQDAEGAYMIPTMRAIGGAEHRMGSETGAPDERPAHDVTLPAFEIACSEVTNAEWALFIADGGYENEQYWETADGRAWREGRSTDEAPSASARESTERFRAEPEQLDSLFAEGHMSEEWNTIFKQRIAMSSEEFEEHLEELYPGGRLTSPLYWDDPRFAHPSQPVVGICWFEARAYAAWLAARSGQTFRLPTEAEWEAACRLFNPATLRERTVGVMAANTSETHLWRPTPVGVFSSGNGSAAVEDLVGNVWEWTSSLYGKEAGQPDFPYPYRADDGRQNPDAPADIRRVARGGAWDSPRSVATASVRDAVRPGGRDQAYGMRLACDPA